MNRVQVQSSQIKSIGYDDYSRVLEVEFVKGTIYQYFDVPHYVIFDLTTQQAVGSVGSYFNKNVARKYKYQKVS